MSLIGSKKATYSSYSGSTSVLSRDSEPHTTSEGSRKYLYAHGRRKSSSVEDSLESFVIPENSETRASPVLSTIASEIEIPEEESEDKKANKFVSSVFCVHFGIFVVCLTGILIVLYHETVKFLLIGRNIIYLCSGVLVVLVYVLMLLRQMFRHRIRLLRLKTAYWDIVLLTMMAIVQAFFMMMASTYHDTEILMLTVFSVITVYWILALVAVLRQSSILGWRSYVIGITVLAIILSAEVLLMCTKAHCESLGEIALASAFANLISMHSIYAANLIFKSKWQILNPKDKTNAPILIYIFLPTVILHAIQKCLKR